MKLAVTDEDVVKMAIAAIKASKVMGMGALQHREGVNYDDLAPDFLAHVKKKLELHVDYLNGLMVKFHAWNGPGGWNFDDRVDIEYQSWVGTYKDYKELAEKSTGRKL